MNNKWGFLLAEFSRLGGVADNVYQKKGNFGRGIFSSDPKLKSRIYIPYKLMIKKDDIYLEGNNIRILKDKIYTKEIRGFFNYYQDNFSWGGGGKETVESFEKGLSEFSPNLKTLIKKHMLVDIKQRHSGPWDQMIFREFLQARVFNFNNLQMICPLLELVNHEVISLSFVKQSDGITTPNYPPKNSELTHSYNNTSSINRFFYQGFFSKESIVFSFPFIINLTDQDIHLYCRGEELNDDSISIVKDHNTIFINGLPIADRNNPSLPNEYFNEIQRRLFDINIPKDTLSKIFKLNISIRKEFLAETKLIDNDVSDIFSKIINYEIKLISTYD